MIKGTTICAVKKDGVCAIAGDGQVTLGESTIMKNGAKKVIIAHNHPDGIAIASDYDIETAKKMSVAFGNFDITILDHFVVADGRCIRFMDKNKNRRKV